MQKWAYPPIIWENTWSISTNFSALIEIRVGIIYLTFVLRSLKGRCYGNQLIWGTFCKRQIWLPQVFALAFWNGIQYRHLHQGLNTGNDTATSCKNLVNFGAVTSEITFLICVPLCGYWTKFGLRSPFVALVFAQTRWTIEMLMAVFKAAMDVQISYIQYIWWASIWYFCTWCCSTVYRRHQSALGLIHLRPPRGSTFVFYHYMYSLRGDTAMPGGLYARLCHAFLVDLFTTCTYAGVVFLFLYLTYLLQLS